MRKRTRHEEIQSNSILRNWTAGPRTVHRIEILRNVSRHPTRPPGNSILNHLKDIFYHTDGHF